MKQTGARRRMVGAVLVALMLLAIAPTYSWAKPNTALINEAITRETVQSKVVMTDALHGSGETGDYISGVSYNTYVPEDLNANQSPTADPTSSKILIDGQDTTFDAYHFDGSNYFKLRDLAFMLDGTAKQFSVDYNEDTQVITLTPGEAYIPIGGEMDSKGNDSQSAFLSHIILSIDGKNHQITAYNIGGYNYIKLRDIASLIDFGVGWNGNTDTITIDTGTGYTLGDFSSMEQAYYYKYRELAEKYGTHTVYDVSFAYYESSGHSYLGGVCVVNLLDFNGDGVQDLFVVYSNGQLKRVSENYGSQIFEFPSKDTYEIEIWTYTDGGLKLLLHETSVSFDDSSYYFFFCPNDLFSLRNRVSITIFENADGLPVVQIHCFDKNGEVYEYENIYFSGDAITRDRLSYKDQVFQMNDSETTWDIWIENAAGYDKILLSALLADSWSGTSASLLEGYGIDYNYTLGQTRRTISYLSRWDEVPDWIPNWFIAEGEYISLYMKELQRSNLFFCGIEVSEKYFTNHHYALYDIDQDGIPELILYEGSSGAGTHFHFYTIIDGEAVYCGNYTRASLYVNDDGGLIAFHRRMGTYYADFLSLEGAEIEVTFIAYGQVFGYSPYPELNEFGYEGYRYLPFCPPDIPLGFYTYNQSPDIHY